MITDKVKALADSAANNLNSGSIYTKDQVCYGYADKLVQMLVDDILELIEHTNLTEKTFTTFDRDMATFCRMKIMENIINEYRR